MLELLVVLATVALLTTVLLPNLQRAQEAANRSTCCNNQRTLAHAATMYADRWDGWLPRLLEGEETNHWGWAVDPYLGGGAVRSDDAENADSPYYGRRACPSLRIAAGGWDCSSFGINAQATWVNLHQIRMPASLPLWCDCFLAQPGGGAMPPQVLQTVRGIPDPSLPGGWKVIPRHLGEGLNFSFLDCHGEFLTWYNLQGGGGTFVPGNPDFRTSSSR